MADLDRRANAGLSRIFSRMPLRAALLALALLLPVSALLAGYVGREVNRILTEQTIGALQSELRSLRLDFDRGGIDALATAVRLRSAETSPTFYQLTRPHEAATVGNLTGSFAHVAETGSVFEAGSPSRIAAGIAVPVPGGGRLLVARAIDDQRQLADHLRLAAFASVVLLAGLAVGFGLLASLRVNRRIADVNTTARSIMSGDFSRRIAQDHSGDEFDDLASSLNVMLSRIEDLMQALREVSDNIAHDLKTPLTRLRNRAESAIRDDNASAHREGLERVIEEADGLIQTFNALLLIARLEAGAVDATRTQCEMTELVRDVAELYQPVADDAHLQIDFIPGPSVSVNVNRQLIGQAVANMLDNAIKYSAGTVPTGPVTVTVTAVAEGCEIAVADRGPGIAAGDRERATKRFVRLEQSRSLPGTGLGLSLVAAVARLHGGTVRLEDNAPGLRIVLALRQTRVDPDHQQPARGGMNRVVELAHITR